MLGISRRVFIVAEKLLRAKKLDKLAKPTMIVLRTYKECSLSADVHIVILRNVVIFFTLTLSIKTTFRQLSHSRRRLLIVIMQEFSRAVPVTS